MENSHFDSLANTVQSLEILDSLYDVKILAYLIQNPQPISGKALSKKLEISDSKVYPSLKYLNKLNLILKNDLERPHKYIIQPPEILENFLRIKLKDKKNKIDLLTTELIELIHTGWNASGTIEDRASLTFSGNAIVTQITSLMNMRFNKARIMISGKFKPYIENLLKLMNSYFSQNSNIDLAIPHSQFFTDQLEKIIANQPSLCELRQSNLKSESIFIFDDK